jgi:hypothetical protein
MGMTLALVSEKKMASLNLQNLLAVDRKSEIILRRPSMSGSFCR